MVSFIAFVALANLVLGYALAVYVRGRSGRSLREFVNDLIDTTSHVCPVVQTSPSTVLPHDDDEALARRNEPNALNSPNNASTSAAIGKGSGGLVTADYVEQLLAELAAASDPLENPASVVLVELDSIDVADCVPEGRLLSGITNAVREMLADAHTATRFNDQQLLLLLPGDDELVATQLAERVRQRVEATEFFIDEERVRATVSCALVQLSADDTVGDLLTSLRDTLSEAQRLGGNRTYLYDGMTPLPVVPPELNLSPQTCAV